MDQRIEDAALGLARAEMVRAKAQYPRPFASAHEAIGVLVEEFDELKEQAFARETDPARLREEAVQVAATALRIVVDLTGGAPTEDAARCMRDRVCAHLDAHPGVPFRARTLAAAMGLDEGNVNSLRTMLGELATAGRIARGSRRGEYRSKLARRP